jgi:hypothetical protein
MAAEDREPDGSDAGGLDRDLDELYGVPLDVFVATRDRLARERRANGDSNGAAELRGRRKPSRAAWALNRAVRDAPAALDAVVSAGVALRATQQRSLAHADASALRDATRNRHDAVRFVADIAVASLGPTGESARAAIEETLNAASLDPEAAALVRAGQLSEELGPVDVFATLEPSPSTTTRAQAPNVTPARVPPSPARAERPAPKKPAPPREPNAAAMARLGTARAEAAAATAELQTAEAAHERARVALDEAAAAVERAEDAAASARRANHDAAQRARDARRRAANAEQQLRQAEGAAARAESDR